MIVYLCGFGDWAGMAAHFAEATRRTGREAVSYAKYHHTFEYIVSDKIWQTLGAIHELPDAEVVVLMHTSFLDRKISFIDSSKQLIGAFHGGPPFRGNEELIIERLRKRHGVHFHLIQTPEMYVPGDSNYLIGGVVDTDYLKPHYYNGDKRRLVFAHYPRPTGRGLITKGTDRVVEALSASSYSSRIKFVADTKQKPWAKHMERVSKCDVYVEKLSPIPEFGLSALEAAALGKIVITQSAKNRDEYERLWGEAPILHAYNALELRRTVNKILSWSREEIIERQKLSRKWAEDCHSMKSVGRRLNRIFKKEAEKNNLKIFGENKNDGRENQSIGVTF